MKSAYAEVRCFMLILFLHFGLYFYSVFFCINMQQFASRLKLAMCVYKLKLTTLCCTT